MERYTELKNKIVATIADGVIEEKNEVTLSQSISEFKDILNTSDNAVSAAQNDLGVLIPLFNKYVLSTNMRIRQASVPVFEKLQIILTENLKLKQSDWWKEYKKSFEGNCKTLASLKDNGCAEWPDIWCTMTRLLGNELHSSVTLTNNLCKIVEKAFKNKTANKDKEIQNGFYCWKSIVDGFTMAKEPLKKSRAEFLLMPFKSPSISQSKSICEVKLEVRQIEDALEAWLHTLSKLSASNEAFIDSVLPPLIDYMFVSDKAAFKFISASRCADEFIGLLKMPSIFKRQAVLLTSSTAICIETVKDNKQLSQIVWMTALDAIKKHIESIGIDDPKTDALLTELISVIDKLASNLPSTEFADLLMMCIQGKHKLLPLKSKFQMLIDIAMKPKKLSQLQSPKVHNVIQALLRLYMPKERTEKIFSVAFDALQVAAADTENNDEKTNMVSVLGDAWRAIVGSLIESIQWIDLSAQFICPFILFPLMKNILKCDSKSSMIWKNLLSACIKTSDSKKKNIINELIKHLASLDTESYSASLEVMNMISDMCESFDAIPYYSGVMDSLLKNSNSDSLNPIIQSLFESMLKYAKKNTKEASKLMEIVNKLSNSKHEIPASPVRKTLSKFLSNMAVMGNTTPEKSSKFLHRLAKAKEIQSQNNNRSPTSSPVGLFHLNSVEKKSSPLSKSSPSVKSARKNIDEESSQDFVMVPPKPKKTVLTNHQKEKLSTRRCDIPALYQDLSQDTMSMDSILNAGTVDGQISSALNKKDDSNIKNEVNPSLCEDAVGFDGAKPAVKEEIVMNGHDEKEDEEIIEDTQVLEKAVDVLENKSNCQSTGEPQDDSTKSGVTSSTGNSNGVVIPEDQCKESKENILDIPIKSTDGVTNQISDDVNKDDVSKVKSPIVAVEESQAIVQRKETSVPPSIEQMETEDNNATTAEPKLVEVENPDEKQEIQNNTESDPTSDKNNIRTRKSATPLRKSDRKSKNRISPNKVQLLGKRRSLNATGIDVTKSPATPKRSKLQSRKSIAVVQSHSDTLKKDVEEHSDKVETSELKNNSAKDVSKKSSDTEGSKTESIEDPKRVETNNSIGEGGKSTTKQRKRALESTTSKSNNFEEKSPTLKKRLRRSMGATNNSDSPGIVNKKSAIRKSKSKLEPQSVQGEDRTEVDASKNGKQSTVNSEAPDVASNEKQNDIVEVGDSCEQAGQTNPIVVVETIKNDVPTNSEIVADKNGSNSQSNAIVDTPTRKVSNAPIETRRLTPRSHSKKKSSCSCCAESSVSPKGDRKERRSRTLFDQLTPTRKKIKNTEQSIDKNAETELNNSILSELDCLQASSGSNTVLPSKKNEFLQSVGTDKKPEIGSPTLSDSGVIDIHISDKEKMEFENCTLIENGDGKENQELNHVSKKVIPDESLGVELIPDLKATLDSDIICPVSESNDEIKNKDEAADKVEENTSKVDQNLEDEEKDLKSNTEVQKSKKQNKGLDSWVIRSERVDKNKDSHNESVTEENRELNESNLSNHIEGQAISDSDESFIVSSQQPTDSVIKIKRQSNSFAKKPVPSEDTVLTCTENEKCNTSKESSKQIVETESDLGSNTETEQKSESFSKSHVCRRLLDNLGNNKEGDEIPDENLHQGKNEPDLSFINDDVYCQLLSQEETDNTNQITIKEATNTISHVSSDHDYVSPIRKQNVETDKSSSMNSNSEAAVITVDACQSSNKSTDKTTVPDMNSAIDDKVPANKNSKMIDEVPNKKNDSALLASKNNHKYEKPAKLSSPDRSKILMSPSRASRIKRMASESANESPNTNEVFDLPESKIKAEHSSPEREMNKDEFIKVVSPPSAFKSKQSVSPEQSSSSTPRSTRVYPPSPSRALKIKHLIQSKSSTEQTIPACSSPKKSALCSQSKISIENVISTPPPVSRIDKALAGSSMQSPEKSISFDNQEKNGMEGNCSVASSPQTARGRTAQLMGLVNGDSPAAQSRRNQLTPKRIRPLRIIAASDTEKHEGEDYERWVCKTYSPCAVPSPSILKTRMRTDDLSPQSSPHVTRTKLSDDTSEISPPAKKKRVYFHDPPLTQKLFFFKTGSGKVVSQGKSSEPDPKSSVQETVTDVPAAPIEPVESSCSTNNVINCEQTSSSFSVDVDSTLTPSSASLKTLWNDVNEEEKLKFISHSILENRELLGSALGNVSCDTRKLLVEIMCNDPEFVSLISKDYSVVRCITQDIESLSDNISKLDEKSQLGLMKNVDESVKMKLLEDISPEMRVSILSDGVCTDPKLLKKACSKIEVEDLAEEIASHLRRNAEVGEKILEKVGVDKVADLMISGINILKMKR